MTQNVLKFTSKQLEFLQIATDTYGVSAKLVRSQIKSLCEAHKIGFPFWFFKGPYHVPTVENSLDGKELYYQLPNIGATETPRSIDSISATDYNEIMQKRSIALTEGLNTMSSDSLVPEIDPLYKPFGFFKDLLGVVESLKFFPMFIAGDSGYGKTLMVEQVAATAKRPLIRIPISSETDKTSLLVVPTLVDGNLSYENGPVLDAMEMGAILLLDEIDRGTNNLICLNGIMEGKPYYNEKTRKNVYPAPGFTVLATANSKGQGSTSKYITNILDDSFLERFPITVTQQPPPSSIEEEILSAHLQFVTNFDTSNFASNLVKWANNTRTAEKEGVTEASISTRRLVEICKTFAVFGDRIKAVSLCINRFPEFERDSFLDFYSKIDATTSTASEAPLQDAWVKEEEEYTF